MAMEPHRRPTYRPMHDNVVQLRRDIDTGRTGDKVRVDDPAAAPLGTDDEAAGTPPSPEAVRVARALERRDFAASPKGPRLRNGLAVLLVIAVLLAAAAALLLLP